MKPPTITIRATIRVGKQPERQLGLFTSVEQAVRILCPPTYYNHYNVSGKGEVSLSQRRNHSGLRLTEADAETLRATGHFTWTLYGFSDWRQEQAVRFERL